MKNLLAHDLCAAREKAGLTQRDVSILLEANVKEVSALETGQRPPSVRQLCKLSIIYNRSFTDSYEQVIREARADLFRHLPDLPKAQSDGMKRYNRDNTIARLNRTLAAALTQKHEVS